MTPEKITQTKRRGTHGRAAVLAIVGFVLVFLMATPGWANRPPLSATPVPNEPADSPATLNMPIQVQESFPTGPSTPGETNPSVLQTLYVPASENSIVKTAFALQSGVTYTFRVTGLWVWGGCDPQSCPNADPTYLRWADAGYLTDDHFNSFADPVWSSLIYLTINGIRASFGAYNDNHIYATQIVGNGSQAELQIKDCAGCYGDNSGSLRVEIFEGNPGEAMAVGAKAFLQRSQINYQTRYWNWGDDLMQWMPEDQKNRCGTEAQPGEARLCQYGCLVTSFAMLIDRWGHKYNFHTSPRELNNWLCENDGYFPGSSNLVRHKAAEYVRDEASRFFVDFYAPGPNPTRLHNLIGAGYPVILGLGGHYVLATGERWSAQTRTYLINDPGGCNVDVFTWPLTTLDQRYGDSYVQQIWGFELAGGGESLASLSIALASPAELLVTDPSGLRTGLDPRTGVRYNENPDASYFEDQIVPIDEQTEPTGAIKWYDTNSPLDGAYTIKVIGTGAGPYHMLVQGYDLEGDPSDLHLSAQIEPGDVHTYYLDFSTTPGLQPSLRSGVFLPLVSK